MTVMRKRDTKKAGKQDPDGNSAPNTLLPSVGLKIVAGHPLSLSPISGPCLTGYLFPSLTSLLPVETPNLMLTRYLKTHRDGRMAYLMKYLLLKYEKMSPIPQINEKD